MKDDQRESVAFPDPAKEVYWTPLMAVVWIVYRDMNEVRKVWRVFVKDRCDFKFENNQKYIVTPIEAVADLWRTLESGALSATGIFQGLRRVIEPWEWCDLLLIDCERPARFFSGTQPPRKTYLAYFDGPRMTFDDVRLPADVLLGLFPSKDCTRSQSIELGERTTSAARPRSSPKLTKVQATKNALLRRYPEGRPSSYASQLLTDVEPEVGVISLRTMSRALALAWPSAARLRDKN
jgi:hypothetical protein